MRSQLPCISIRQPWAQLIAVGIKPVENRHRQTKHRGLVGIHASAQVDPHAPRSGNVAQALRTLNIGSLHDLPLGRIVAVATLTGCHRANGCCQPWGEQSHVWHLTLSNVRTLPEPVPARGCLAVPWRANPDTTAMVAAQVDLAC